MDSPSGPEYDLAIIGAGFSGSPELRQQAQRLAFELVRDLQPPVPARGVATFEI